MVVLARHSATSVRVSTLSPQRQTTTVGVKIRTRWSMTGHKCTESITLDILAKGPCFADIYVESSARSTTSAPLLAKRLVDRSVFTLDARVIVPFRAHPARNRALGTSVDTISSPSTDISLGVVRTRPAHYLAARYVSYLAFAFQCLPILDLAVSDLCPFTLRQALRTDSALWTSLPVRSVCDHHLSRTTN